MGADDGNSAPGWRRRWARSVARSPEPGGGARLWRRRLGDRYRRGDGREAGGGGAPPAATRLAAPRPRRGPSLWGGGAARRRAARRRREPPPRRRAVAAARLVGSTRWNGRQRAALPLRDRDGRRTR